MNLSLLFFIGIFLLSVVTVLVWALIARKKGLVGLDYCRKQKHLISEAGGIGLWIPLIIGTITAFILTNNWGFFAWLALVLIFSVIGLMDDLKQKFFTKAVRWKTRALPIAIISLMFAFFFASSWLWIIPIALFIAGLASLNNTFAGLNG